MPTNYTTSCCIPGFSLLICLSTSKLRSRVEIRGKKQREREACVLDRLSRGPKLNRFQSLRKHSPVPATFDHRRWAICQNLIFIYSGSKHPEVNLLLALLNFLSLSPALSSSLSLGILKHHKIFVQYATGPMSVETFVRKKKTKSPRGRQKQSLLAYSSPSRTGECHQRSSKKIRNKKKMECKGKKRQAPLCPCGILNWVCCATR